MIYLTFPNQLAHMELNLKKKNARKENYLKVNTTHDWVARGLVLHIHAFIYGNTRAVLTRIRIPKVKPSPFPTVSQYCAFGLGT